MSDRWRHWIGMAVLAAGIILAAPGLLLVHAAAFIDKGEPPW